MSIELFVHTLNVSMLIACGVFLTLLATALIGRMFRESSKKQVAVSATVIGCSETRKCMSYNKKNKPRCITEYTAVFQTKKVVLKFQVTLEEYQLLQKGQTGILKYQASRFISFEPIIQNKHKETTFR